MEALDEMNKVTDESDPDVDVPNLMHAFQTAERIREKHPNDGTTVDCRKHPAAPVARPPQQVVYWGQGAHGVAFTHALLKLAFYS